MQRSPIFHLTRLALTVEFRVAPTVVIRGRVPIMMTIRRLSVGSGYRYLLKSISVGDGPEGVAPSSLVRYYAQSGTPPGVFLGAGLGGLDGGRGVAVGQIVTAENLRRMLQDCADPLTGEVLGRPPSTKGVGGFDLTFSPTKSVSVAWALADRKTREVIFRCHRESILTVLSYAEEHVFKTRSGTRGCVEEEIRGAVAASFTHFDSRDGDPQLHDHVVVLNRVQTKSDGQWRTLDSRGLFASAVMLSELHQGVLADLLTKELGWDWEPHTRRSSVVPKWEVDSVPAALLEEFSQRSADIVAAKDELIAQFEVDHGRSPTDVEVLKLRQVATLATRRAKEGRSLGQLTTDWTTRALPYLDEEPTSWVHELGQRGVTTFSSADFDNSILRDVANTALDVVSTKRATFSQANVQAEVLRQLQGVRFSDPTKRIETAARTTGLALAQALLITAPNLHHTPRFLLRPDGTSKFHSTGHWRYTTKTLLDAEARLLDAAERMDAPSTPRRTVASVTSRTLPGRSFTLSEDQARCIIEIATSSRSLDLLVGPAGTGKSIAMAGLRAAWEHEHGDGSVVALAPSAASAEVLGEDTGLDADTLAKWLHEHRQSGQRRRELTALRERVRAIRHSGQEVSPALRANITHRQEDLHRWTLRAGQLVVVDEASLAATFALDELVSAATDAGAKVLLVGDPAQLSSIEAGGMFRTLVRDRGADVPTLADVRRFRSAWEKRATLQIREGATSALAAYLAHERVTEGSREELLDALYLAWKHDCDAGLHSLMLAGDTATVEELNAMARADRLESGLVQEGITVGDLDVGVGDLVVTRENDRRLRTATGWVKNGDEWEVVATHDNGSLTLSRLRGGESVALPPHYVASHVELAYASTVHRAQGRTVDTAHAFISPATTREVLYVALTRGSTSNHVYVDASYDPDPDTGHQVLTPSASAVDVLEGVLQREGANVSATDVIRAQQSQSLASLVAEYETIAALADGQRWERVLVDAGLSHSDLDRARSSDAFHTLRSRLREAELRGLDCKSLSAVIRGRTFDDADDVAATLAHRVGHYLDAMGCPDLREDQLIAGLLPREAGVDDSDVACALEDRAIAIEQRAFSLANAAVSDHEAWILDYGDAPTDPEIFARWIRHVASGTVYRELSGTYPSQTAGANAEDGDHLSRTANAIELARRLTTSDECSVGPESVYAQETELVDVVVDFSS